MTYRERKRYRRTRKPSKIFLALFVLLLTGVIAVLSLAGYVLSVASSAPPLDSLKPVDQGTSSAVYAADGTRLGFIQSDEIRTPIPLQRIPESMQAATVAIEDERFYRHGGVDYEGIARAAFKNLEAGKAVEGGSTITQQLVRNLYVGRERTLERKIREARLAEELEDRHSKRWILQSYLNSVPYGTVDGQTAVGVQAAAQTFFAKPAKNLTLEESALLAGLPQSPSRLNPFQNPREALERRNKVLEKMADLGYISDDRALEARRAPLGVRRGDLYIKIREPFFFDYVKQQLIDRFGVNTVRKGGLKVYTTIDPKLQKAGREAIDSTLPYPGDPSSAVVAIDPRTGYIRAMASSSKYKHAQYNLAAQGHRQPGSAFKTFVLATAIKRGREPVLDQLRLATARPEDRRLRPVEGADLRRELRRLDEPGARHAQVGQHRVRAARPRPRPEERRGDREGHGHHDEARRLPGRGAGRTDARGLSPGDGQRVRDPRVGRDAQQADRDPEGASSPTVRSRTSASPSASVCSPTRRPTR